MSMDVRSSGPLFVPGLAETIMDAELSDASELAAENAEARVQLALRGSLKNPTGYYQSRIRTTRLSADTNRVDDQRVVYGPWLEGTSRRNRETRFKGYHTFRLTAQGMEGRARDIAQAAAKDIVGRLS